MRKVLKGIGIGVAVLLGVVVLAAAGALIYGELSFKRAMDRPLYEIQANLSPEGVAHGEYLVRSVAACADCHGPSTKPFENAQANLVGRYEEINQGPIQATIGFPNLTPDKETGLGAWTDAEIARAIREGVDREGRGLVLMPSFNLHVLSDNDVADIVGYLRSLEPVKNEIPTINGNAIMKAMVAFGVMGPSPVGEPITEPQAEVTPRGKYLVTIGSCTDCHQANLAGGPIPFSDPESVQASNLTPAGELAGWTEADFLNTLHTGVTPSGRKLDPMMPWGVYGKMTDEDLSAIFAYLKSLPPAKPEGQ